MDSKYKKLESPTTLSENDNPSSPYNDEVPTGDLDSSQPFLADMEREENMNLDGVSRFKRQRSYTRAILPHFLIFLLYTFTFIWAMGVFRQQLISTPLTYTPAQDVVEYERVFYDGSIDRITRYTGDPRPDLEIAWHNLTENLNIKLSKDEIKKLGKEPLELADGSGYHGQLNVYHHLHCLKYLRMGYYPDDYERPSKQHIDHCIEDLRQALMCHPDLSISTLHWIDGIRRPMPDFKLNHTCVNWDKLDEWARQRAFSMFDQKSLVNPKYGLAFPLINGSIEYTPPGPDMHVVWPSNN